MPLVGRVTGGLDFSNYYLPLKEVPAGTPATLDAVKKAGVPVFAYGNFITILLYFLILAWIIFIMVKWINKLRRDVPAPAAAEEAEEVKLLRDIRDSLKRA
jgi:large conductance mechanosensitive channel